MLIILLTILALFSYVNRQVRRQDAQVQQSRLTLAVVTNSWSHLETLWTQRATHLCTYSRIAQCARIKPPKKCCSAAGRIKSWRVDCCSYDDEYCRAVSHWPSCNTLSHVTLVTRYTGHTSHWSHNSRECDDPHFTAPIPITRPTLYLHTSQPPDNLSHVQDTNTAIVLLGDCK